MTFDKFFMEETESVLNTWTTELHLSFYKIGQRKTVDTQTSPDAMQTGLLTLTDFEGRSWTQIIRVSTSFRFDGDFFDRYWTCWFLEADPQSRLTPVDAGEDLSNLLQEEQQHKNNIGLHKSPWRQRRVLELLLFRRVIKHMRKSADSILGLARSSVRKGNRNPEDVTPYGLDEDDGLDYNTFLATRRRFERFQKVLQIVQGDLAENLTRIDQWLAREKERQAERPRWTYNDESRYRSAISKLDVYNDHEVQELRRSYARIASFNDSIAKKLEIMRNDVDQRRADDIQRFTWVTVFFLPMGFATGIFSMNGAPGGRTLWQMIVTMTCALFVTALLLVYSKSIERLYDWVSQFCCDFGKRIYSFKKSFEKRKTESDPERGPNGNEISRKQVEARRDKQIIQMMGESQWNMAPP